MTTMAAMFGGVPLMLGAGAGSELRQPLGYTIVGGLALSQLLTLYTTPVVYLYLDRLQLMLVGESAARSKRAVAPAGSELAPGVAVRLSRIAVAMSVIGTKRTPRAHRRMSAVEGIVLQNSATARVSFAFGVIVRAGALLARPPFPGIGGRYTILDAN